MSGKYGWGRNLPCIFLDGRHAETATKKSVLRKRRENKFFKTTNTGGIHAVRRSTTKDFDRTSTRLISPIALIRSQHQSSSRTSSNMIVNNQSTPRRVSPRPATVCFRSFSPSANLPQHYYSPPTPLVFAFGLSNSSSSPLLPPPSPAF